MKRINFLLSAALLLGLLVYSGCGSSGDGPSETAAQLRLKDLSGGTWSASAGSVTRDGSAENTYDNFTLSFSGTINDDKDNVINTSSYTTNDNTNVFPSGTWQFGSSLNTVVRGSGITMTTSSTDDYETSLIVTFSLNADGSANGKTAGLAGTWVFNLTK